LGAGERSVSLTWYLRLGYAPVPLLAPHDASWKDVAVVTAAFDIARRAGDRVAARAAVGVTGTVAQQARWGSGLATGYIECEAHRAQACRHHRGNS
jgi:hypothetical protein